MIAHVFVLMLVYFGMVDGKMQGGINVAPFQTASECESKRALLVKANTDNANRDLIGFTLVCVSVDVKLLGGQPIGDQ